MKCTTFLIASFAALACVRINASTSSDVHGVTNFPPQHHPLVKFSSHFRCPYAQEWVTKGPHQAAVDLGILGSPQNGNYNIHNTTATTMIAALRNTQQNHMRGAGHVRHLQNDDSEGAVAAVGHCTFTNSWTGQPSCVEFRGDVYTAEEMDTRCAREQNSTLVSTTGCMIGEDTTALAGWCYVAISEGKIEATPLMGDCTQNQMACESFMTGTFAANAAVCGEGEDSQPVGTNATEDSSQPPYENPLPPEGPVTCHIAPGAIGAAHQAGYSQGYSDACPGTPAERSPFMWPVAWRANVESKSMAYGSDDVLYHSKGIVSYRLDKNWKRQDWYYQRGVQRSIGQAPCDPENIDTEFSQGPLLACNRNSDEYTSMIHRGSKMIFISWMNGTEVGSSNVSQITECNYLDLQVVGNVRPDWFMDDRGDSTDVQYLGDQHVYYDGQPRLVKQWRKRDFANQYFVMSIQGNPLEDGRHWPMILNVPGEGFGDDFLQQYTNHTSLNDDDDYLFLLDEALEDMGRSCPEMIGFGSDGVGPPTNSDIHIPSNLEVDPNSWFSNVYTYSPVWEPEVATDEGIEEDIVSDDQTGVATTDADRVTVKSCYEQSSSSVRLSVEYRGITKVGSSLPWLALGYRTSEECLMTPRSGEDTPVILIMDDGQGAQAYQGSLPATARSGSESAVGSIYPSLVSLEESETYSNVILLEDQATTSFSRSDVTGDSLVLEFSQSVDSVPEVMHLMYAIGSQSTLGFHATRSCFEVTKFPMCPEGGMSSSSSGSAASEDELSSSADSYYTTGLLMLFGLATLVGLDALFGSLCS